MVSSREHCCSSCCALQKLTARLHHPSVHVLAIDDLWASTIAAASPCGAWQGLDRESLCKAKSGIARCCCQSRERRQKRRGRDQLKAFRQATLGSASSPDVCSPRVRAGMGGRWRSQRPMMTRGLAEDTDDDEETPLSTDDDEERRPRSVRELAAPSRSHTHCVFCHR
jgi:hypothetical protein